MNDALRPSAPRLDAASGCGPRPAARVIPAFSTKDLLGLDEHVGQGDDPRRQLGADAARRRALERAGFAPAPPSVMPAGPTTLLTDVRFVRARDAPSAWVATGWRSGVPEWLAKTAYLGATISVRVRTVSINPDSGLAWLDKAARREHPTVDGALLQALDERLDAWGARELLQEIQARELRPPAVVEMWWTPTDATTVTLATDHPLQRTEPTTAVQLGCAPSVQLTTVAPAPTTAPTAAVDAPEAIAF